MDAVARRRILFGTDEPPLRRRMLRAGDLSCCIAAGALQSVHWRDTEILRGVAYLLRDADWGTVPAKVRGQRLATSGEDFVLRWTLTMQHRGATLDAELVLEVHADGRLSLTAEAVADGPLQTNRCGLVLLHPADCAGRPLRVTHGRLPPSETEFPTLIQPSQPVFDIRALHWSPRPGLGVDCSLEAQLPGLPQASFEMEDQRNWSDASFKTYVGSLRDPWPYVLPHGVRLRQRLVMQLQDERPTTAIAGPATTRQPLSIGAASTQRMPPLGLGVPHLDLPPDRNERQAVASLRPGWLVVQADLARADVLQQLRTAVELAAASGAHVQLDVLCPQGVSPEACASRIAAHCASAGCSPSALRLLPSAYLQSYQPDGQWPEVPPLAHYAQAAARAFPQARIGGGMATFFTELNRKRPPAEGLQFIGHSTCPAVHAADDDSVMQTLQSLPAIAASVRACWPGLGWRLGPSSMGTLRNPYGSAPAENPGLKRLPLAKQDPRHHGQFGAAWCAGYAVMAVQLGAELVSLLHSHGPNGPLSCGHGPGGPPGRHASDDESARPACVPAWAALRLLASWQGAHLHPLQGLPDGVLALASGGPATSGVRLFLVNTRPQRCSVRLDRPMQAIDFETHEPDGSLPLTTLRLPGYGLACLVEAQPHTP